MRDPDQKQKPAIPRKSVGSTSREDRLKAALKANMARRKTQAKARAASAADANNKNE